MLREKGASDMMGENSSYLFRQAVGFEGGR